MFSRPIPGSYMVLDEQISRLVSTGRDTLDMKEITEIATDKCHIPVDGVGAAIRFFHDVGTLVHVDDAQAELNELVVINPQWLVDVMSSLVNVRLQMITKKNGLISPDTLNQVWSNHTEKAKVQLLLLLQKFEIIFQLRVPAQSWRTNTTLTDILQASFCSSFDNKPSLAPPTGEGGVGQDTLVLVPSLFPHERPAPSELWKGWGQADNMQSTLYVRFYQFSYYMIGFMSRVTVRVLHLENAVTVNLWHNGITLAALSKGSTSYRSLAEAMEDPLTEVAHLEYLEDTFKLVMIVRCPTAKKRGHTRLLDRLIYTIDSLLKGFYPGLSESSGILRHIPCKHCLEKLPAKGLDIKNWALLEQKVIDGERSMDESREGPLNTSLSAFSGRDSAEKDSPSSSLISLPRIRPKSGKGRISGMGESADKSDPNLLAVDEEMHSSAGERGVEVESRSTRIEWRREGRGE